MASATPSRRSNHGSISLGTRRQREDDAAVLAAADAVAEAARARAERLRGVARAEREALEAEVEAERLAAAARRRDIQCALEAEVRETHVAEARRAMEAAMAVLRAAEAVTGDIGTGAGDDDDAVTTTMVGRWSSVADPFHLQSSVAERLLP